MVLEKSLTRRNMIKVLASTVVAAPALSLIGCGGSSVETADIEGSADQDTTTPDTSTPDTNTSWASGGTSSMTVDYPDISIFEAGSSCLVALTPNLTEGPCYFEADVMDDISEQQGGLPMQLCLQVVDSDCNPVSALEVEVWHCDRNGLYSGDTSGSADSSRFAGSFCTANDSEAVNAKWFRGTQVTDSDGRVNFQSCFPGWYSGRTIHIHFRVRNNNSDQVISQFCFTDEFAEEICTQHPEYSARGNQDTTLAGGRDTVFADSAEEFTMNTAQNTDGSLLAWKTIQIS